MLTRKMIVGLAIFAVVFSIPSWSFAAKRTLPQESSTAEKIILEYEFAAPSVSKMNEYDLLKIEGLELHERVGAPIVPIRPVNVSIPLGKKVLGTRLIVAESEELPGTYKLPPGQRSYPLSYTGVIEKTNPDPAIYGKAEPWPGIYRKELGTQSKRGYQIFLVNLFPIQYVPTTGRVSYAKKMRLEIDLGISKKKQILRPTIQLKASLKQEVDNPAAIESYPLSPTSYSPLSETSGVEGMVEAGMGILGEGGSPLDDPNCQYYATGDDDYRYVIITSQDLADADTDPNFRDLCDSKWDRGIPACIVTTEWIYANYDGTRPDGNSDNQTRIRNFLIDAYQNWQTQYVLLGGTNAIIPARLFQVGSSSAIDDMPVDMYYGCVEPSACTFDYNADGDYGGRYDGVGGGDVDLLAEIYVGRATVENSTELSNFIKKTLTYGDLTQNEYLERVAMLGEFLGYGGVSEYAKDSMEQIRLGGEYNGYFTYGFENHTNTDFIDFNTVGCIPDNPSWCWPLYEKDAAWSGSNVIDLMNAGIHVFNHLGHSNGIYCMKLYTWDLPLLTNDDYFFAYSQGCYAGAFDVPYRQFAEVITSMEYGAFAVIMNARSGYVKPNSTNGASQRFNRQFWDAVLGDERILEVGRANQDSKEDNLWDINGESMRWCYYQLNLFGDPEQRLFNNYFPGVHNSTQDVWYWEIQDAINEANDYDEIIVYPGTYYESVDAGGVSCTITSSNPNDWDVVKATVIDGAGATNTVTLGYGATGSLSGFTVTGGTRGLYCMGSSSAVVSNCIVTNNSDKGAMFYSCNGTVTNCIIRDNGNEAISVESAYLTVTNNLIYNNDVGVYTGPYCTATIRNCTIVDNDSYGVLRTSQYSSVPISNCILWGNGDDLYDCSATYSCISNCNDVGDPNVTHNICTDPCFVDDANDDYHLKLNSPCINTGDPDGNYDGEVDIDGQPRRMDLDGQTRPDSIVDMGADEAVGKVHNLNQDTWFYHIQDAINASQPNDTIVVYPGTYYENINFSGKAITLRSTDPNDWDVVEATIIDGGNIGTVVSFSSDENPDSVLWGFTITNAGNVSGNTGAGVSCSGTVTLLISNCIIENAWYGIYCRSAILGEISLTITNCKIINTVFPVMGELSSDLVVKNSMVYKNRNGISHYGHGLMTVINTSIVSNIRWGIRGGDHVSETITNCIIWDSGNDLFDCSATYSCIEDGDAGEGNISEDPCFVDVANDDYHLRPDSPCINTGDPCFAPEPDETDIDGDPRVVGNGVDMGADEALRVHNITQDKWYVYIQDAIDEANSLDEIVAHPGTYYESVDAGGVSCTITSSNPNDWDVVNATAIDGAGTTNTVTLGYGATGSLSGFTVRGGTRGLYCMGSSSAVVSNCIIRNNSDKGAMFNSCNGTITNCIIRDNGNEAISVQSAGLTVKNSLIHDNDDGVVVNGGTTVHIHNCTIANNDSYGVIRTEPYYSDAHISNCILWGNGDDLYDCNATYSWLTADGDPLFVDADSNDFHLEPNSPCIDAGDPSGNYEGQTDIDNDMRVFGTYVDMGADEADSPDAHWWKLDEDSGTTAYDSVGDDDGSFNGSDPCWVDGLIGGAIDCNGVSDYFSVPTLDNAYDEYDTFTVAGWFKTEQSTGMQTIVGQWSHIRVIDDIYFNHGWQVLVENNKVVARFGYDHTDTEDITGTSDVNDGEWHHFALSYPADGSKAVLYVDGDSEGTPPPGAPIAAGDTKFRIGDGSYVSDGTPTLKGGPFDGTIDDIMISERELSAEEVQQLYSRGGL